jgi:ubiquitin carboxyl-terminal hydrolase 10
MPAAAATSACAEGASQGERAAGSGRSDKDDAAARAEAAAAVITFAQAVAGLGSGDAVRQRLFELSKEPAAVAAVVKSAGKKGGAGKVVALVPLPRGLVNLGNTCFANAVMQCVLQTPCFGALWAQSLALLRGLREAGESRAVECIPLLSELASLHADVSASVPPGPDGLSSNATGLDDATAVRPDRFLWAARAFFARQGLRDAVGVNQAQAEFRVKVATPQQDAHEFLEWLLDSLNEEQLLLSKGAAEAAEEAAALRLLHPHNGAVPAAAADDAWLEVGKGGKGGVVANKVGTATEARRMTYISEAFQGVLRSSVHVPGLKDSVTLQPFMCLQLDVLRDAVKSVEDALDLYMADEQLTGLTGAAGAGPQTGTRKLLFDRLPRVLVLHLKRFVFSLNSGAALKLRKVIKFPERLEIKHSYLAQQLQLEVKATDSAAAESGLKRVRSYQLHAVCKHIGEHAVRGHYTSIARALPLSGASQTPCWSAQDDGKVRQLSLNDVLNDPDAYLLFYHRE